MFATTLMVPLIAPATLGLAWQQMGPPVQILMSVLKAMVVVVIHVSIQMVHMCVNADRVLLCKEMESLV